MMLPHPQSLKVRKLALFLSYELEEQFSRYDRMLAKSPGGTFCNDDDTPFPCFTGMQRHKLPNNAASNMLLSSFLESGVGGG